MQNAMLLESIWQGDIYASNSRRCREIIRLLGLILPLDMVHLSARSGVSRSCIVSEHIELLPEIHLGDVLVEELDADVPLGAMIVIVKEQSGFVPSRQANVSYELGLLIGDVLINLIKDCVFPIQCESDVLAVLTNSYCRLIGSSELQKQNICSQSFNNGLIFSSNEYFEGQPLCKKQVNLEDQKRSSNKNVVSMHLKNMEAHIGKRMFGEASINLTELNGSVFGGNDWKKSMSEAVMGKLRKDAVRVSNHYG